MFILSTLIVSGITSITLKPNEEPTKAKPIPVFPDVASIIVAPSFISPFSIASSIIAFATRSFTEPAGLNDSNFTKTLASKFKSFSIFATSTRGVFPINSSADLYTLDILTSLFISSIFYPPMINPINRKYNQPDLYYEK